MKSYFEEFEAKYNRPTMNKITVGFSGIDPSPKSGEDDISEIIEMELRKRTATDEQVNAMLNEIW